MPDTMSAKKISVPDRTALDAPLSGHIGTALPTVEVGLELTLGRGVGCAA